jgi:dTDP-4-dehydrorhamnose reductase
MTHAINNPKTLITNSGTSLGRYFRHHLPNAIALHETNADLLNENETAHLIHVLQPNLVIHAASFDDTELAEREPLTAWESNVTATRNLTRHLPPHVKLLHYSSDVVFGGFLGAYSETNPTGPFMNQLAVTVGVAEIIAGNHPNSLIVRTGYHSGSWRSSTAYVDHYFSRDFSTVIFPQLLQVAVFHDRIPVRVLHVASNRKSQYEFAQVTKPNVLPARRVDASVRIPMDVSLDSSLWRQLQRSLPALRQADDASHGDFGGVYDA